MAEEMMAAVAALATAPGILRGLVASGKEARQWVKLVVGMTSKKSSEPANEKETPKRPNNNRGVSDSKIRRTRKEKEDEELQAIQQMAAHLDEMLRNSTHRFRSIEALSRAIHDTAADQRITVYLLQSLGARGNVRPGGEDSWTKDNYWDRNPDGTWRLKNGVPPGRF